MAFWTVKTYHKKNVEQHEHFLRRSGAGKIIVKDGFRWAEFRVETEDDNFPEFEFTEVPGGNGDVDSLDLYFLSGNNIVGSELVMMDDGGCWGDIEFEDVDEAEAEELQELIEENGAWSLEDDGDWYLDETECWVWGPIEVTNDATGESRVVIADEDGNMIDFETDDE